MDRRYWGAWFVNLAIFFFSERGLPIGNYTVEYHHEDIAPLHYYHLRTVQIDMLFLPLSASIPPPPPVVGGFVYVSFSIFGGFGRWEPCIMTGEEWIRQRYLSSARNGKLQSQLHSGFKLHYEMGYARVTVCLNLARVT